MKKSDGLSPKVKILYFHLWFCNTWESHNAGNVSDCPAYCHYHLKCGNWQWSCAIPHNTILIFTNSTPSVQNRNIVWKSSLLRLEFNILSVEFSINLKFSISASLKSYFIEWLQGKIYFGESRILYCNIIYSIRCRGGHLTKKVSKYGKYNKIAATENENECILCRS